MSKVRKIIGFWIVLVMVCLVFPIAYYIASKLLDSVFGFPESPYPLDIHLFGAAIALLVGLYWVLWGYSYLHFVGRGSPAEAFGRALYPTRVLVTSGPYAYTRNPMIFGLLFIALAIALYIPSISGLILIPVLAFIATAYIRKYEEPGLVRRFGTEYERYRDSVPILFPIFSVYGKQPC